MFLFALIGLATAAPSAELSFDPTGDDWMTVPGADLDDEEGVLLARGVAQTAQHPVQTAFFGEQPLAIGRPGTVEMSGVRYSVELDADSMGWAIELVAQTATGEPVTQTLVEHSRADAVPRLLWAGDLDGDGWLDLWIDTSPDALAFEPCLYLSGGALEGNLVASAQPGASTVVSEPLATRMPSTEASTSAL